MTDIDIIAAYLREALWPEQPGHVYSEEMREEIARKCEGLAAGILARLPARS